MANNCFYTMKAVAKDENALKRLHKIMNYEDPEYYMYRVFSCDIDEDLHQDGEFYVAQFAGDVAWGCNSWFESDERPDDKIENGAHYITLDLLCQRLGIAVEVYGEEAGCQFQQWYRCDHNGEVESDSAEWIQTWEDEDGNDLDEPEEEGGLDGYGVFSTNDEIWGEE